MVIGERFVWAHLGKTGGDSVKKMFDIVGQKHVLYADDTKSPKKHQTFLEKERELNIDLSSKYRILTIRRLPSWALSYVFHKQRTLHRPVDFDKLYQGLVFDHYGDNDSSKPVYLPIDTVLNTQICGRIDYWIRTEYLVDDFVQVMSHFFNISWFKKQRLKIIRSNVNFNYKKKANIYFTDKQIVDLYNNCPLWAFFESKLYESSELHIKKIENLIFQKQLGFHGALDVVVIENNVMKFGGWAFFFVGNYLFFPDKYSLDNNLGEELFSISIKPVFRKDLSQYLAGDVGFYFECNRVKFNHNSKNVKLTASWNQIKFEIPTTPDKIVSINQFYSFSL